MSDDTKRPDRQFSHEITLPSGIVAKVNLKHERITVRRKLNKAARAIVQKLLDHELQQPRNQYETPAAKERNDKLLTDTFNEVASAFTYPGTSISVSLYNPAQELIGTFDGYSLCKAPDNFCKVKGIEYALSNASLDITKQDRQALLYALCPSIKKIATALNAAAPKTNKVKVTARRVAHPAKLTTDRNTVTCDKLPATNTTGRRNTVTCDIK